MLHRVVIGVAADNSQVFVQVLQIVSPEMSRGAIVHIETTRGSIDSDFDHASKSSILPSSQLEMICANRAIESKK